MSSQKTESLVLYNELQVERITFSVLKDQKSDDEQVAFPKYNHPELGENQHLLIQFPWIKISAHGVPTLGKYYKADEDRDFIKIPLDTNIPESAKLIEVLKNMDAHFSSEEFASKFLGSKWKKYKYIPIFRIQNSEEDDDDKKKDEKVKVPYMKLKVSIDNETKEVNTAVFKSEMEDQKRKRTLLNIKTMTDFADIVSYLSNIRPIIRGAKLWTMSSKKEWGITFKIIKIEVEPTSKKNSTYKQFMNSDAFLDSDEEKKEKDMPKKELKKVSKLDSEDEEEKPSAVDKKPAAKKVAQVEESDDDSEESEDSEEEKPVIVATSKGKQVKKVSEDDEEEEEEKPATKGKKPIKKVSKVEDEDEEEEEKPAPKPAAKTTRGGKGGKSANA
jgi:hypothetical protein